MLQIEAIQSVMPTKSTDPKTSSNITVVVPALNSSIFLQRRFNIVLCYNRSSSSDEESGWMVAGWIKESLGRALAEQPVFAGRVRRRSELESGELFVVCDDSGVRLVEGKADMKLDDFLINLKSKKTSELVFWEDVFQQNPRFSPLFYVQVTNFSCGGYSIGISCSLLLADPFVLTTFLNNWSNLHNKILSNPNLPKIPLFYLPNLAKPGSSPYSSLPMAQTTSKSAPPAQSIIFTIPTNILNLDNYNNIVALCIHKAEHEVGTKMASKFSLFVKLPRQDFKVEIISRENLSSINNMDVDVDGLTCGKIWDEVKVDKICFGRGNKPQYASCWINSMVDDEGFVMIIASDDLNTLGIKILVTFT